MDSLEKTQQELARLVEKERRDRESVEYYQRQIDRAKKLKKVSFDEERFRDK